MHKLYVFFVTCFLVTLETRCVFAEEQYFYSQYQQDRYIYETVFKNKHNGIFVDIGAHDGITLSNTYFFEKFMGWTGICIEPIPEVFKQLESNRNCLCIQGCIFDNYETVPFLKITGYAEMLSGIMQNYDPNHIRRIQSEINFYGGNSEIIHVKCYNITELLIENNIRHIDYLSIDTEGGELSIIKSIDFDLIEIDVIGVENNYNEPFEQFLAPFGYKKLCNLGCDEIYKKIN